MHCLTATQFSLSLL